MKLIFQNVFLRLFFLLFLTLPSVGYATPDVTIHITDFGINQTWDEQMQAGDDLSKNHKVFPELGKQGQVLLPMPANEILDRSSNAELEAIIAAKLLSRLRQEINRGQFQFEIQLVQHIDTPAYFSKLLFDALPESQQARVKRFGEIAYRSLGRVVDELRKSSNLSLDLTLGSNGTVAFTENVDAWKSFGSAIRRLTLVDGRAWIGATIKTIEALGAEKVRIINTYGDHLAHELSIANINTVQKLLVRFPNLTSLLLTPLDGDKRGNLGVRPFSSHVLSIASLRSRFYVEQVSKGNTVKPLGEWTGRDINPNLTHKDYVKAGSDLPSFGRPEQSRERNPDMPQRPGTWWVYADKKKSESQVLQEINALVGRVPLGQRIVVVGNGKNADLLFAQIKAKVGSANVERQEKIGFERDIPARIFKTGVNLILGIREQLTFEANTDQRFVVARDIAEHLATTASTTAKALTELHLLDKAKNPTLQRLLNPGNSKAMEFLEKTQTLYGIATAIEQDLALSGQNKFTLLRSHTVEELSRIGFDNLWPKFMEVLQKHGVVKTGLPTLGIPEFVGAAATHIGSGKADLDTVTRYFDAVNTAAWGMLGLTISGGNVEVASVYQSIGHGTAKALRFATQSLFDKVVARASGNAQQLEKDWRTLQERSVRNNIQVKTFEEVYGKDLTEKLGISRAEIARLNKEAGAYEANRLASHGGSLTPTSIQQPAPPTARPLGGVELKAIAQLKGDSLPATLTGLVFDEATKRFVLIGDAPLNLPHLTEADLAMALWLVYGPNARDPQFSLDPADPRNPEGKWLKAVYLPEDLKGSGFGETMFIADFLLKQYGFSVRVTESGSIVERKVGVPGFKSLPDMVKGTPSLHAPQWARKWIVSDELKLQRNESGNSLYFDTIKMAVKAKRQIPDPSSKTGLRDIETPLDSVETRWAEMFTERFARIGQEESPEFLRLVELAKAIGIAKFLKQRKIEVDMNWVIQTLNKNRVKATDKVTALSVTWKSEQQKPFNDSRGQGIQTTIETIRLFGGVDLTVRPKYTEDSQTAMAQRQLVTSATKKDPAAPVFTIENLNKVEYAKVLPMISVGSQANQRGWAFDRQWR